MHKKLILSKYTIRYILHHTGILWKTTYLLLVVVYSLTLWFGMLFSLSRWEKAMYYVGQFYDKNLAADRPVQRMTARQ